jgi:ribosome recycling factor
MATLQQYLDDARQHMEKSIEHLENELTKVRAGKISPAIVDGITVDYYGAQTPINQVANVSVADARTLVIQPWEKKMLEQIERGILAANIGITPMNDGNVVKLFQPPLTEERRKEYVKKAHAMAEHARVGVRATRRDAIEHIKKLSKENVPEDEIKTGEAKVQQLTDKYTAIIDKHIEVKEKEIMTV